MAKRYFVEHGIEFVEADILKDPEERREMALMTGQFGVPVIVVGSRAIVGWSQEEFAKLWEARPPAPRTGPF